MQPGTRPFRELAAALGTVAPGAPRGASPSGWIATATSPARSPGSCPTTSPHLVLVIDQLEELWSLVEDDAERARFVAALVEALSARDGRLLVVATLRADFLDRPLRSPGLGELVRAGTELVTPLTRDELERAIVRPAASVGVELEPGLATEVIADVARQPGELPLLQYALTELFERSDGQRLTREGVRGGRRRAGGARPPGRGRVRRPGRRGPRGRPPGVPAPRGAGRVRRADRPAGPARGAPHPRRRSAARRRGASTRSAAGACSRSTATPSPASRSSRSPTRRSCPAGRAWPGGSRRRARTSGRAAAWRTRRPTGSAPGATRGSCSPGAGSTSSRRGPPRPTCASTLPERELLDASLAERRRQDEAAAARAAHERALERRATTQLRALAAVLAVAALVATSLSVVVYGQGEAAREQGAIAAARELAAASIGNLGTDPQLSLLLAWQAADRDVRPGLRRRGGDGRPALGAPGVPRRVSGERGPRRRPDRPGRSRAASCSWRRTSS